MKMNLPNKLTLMRVIMIPIFMAVMLIPVLPETWWRILGAALFVFTSFTDFLDGFIARKFHLVTDFGKLMDPLADKLMVFGAMICLLVRYSEDKLFCNIFVWVIFILLLREFTVTGLRAMVSGSVSVAANWAGKVKTVSQILFIVVILLEPVVLEPLGLPHMLFTYITMALMTFMTIYSGLNYVKAYLPHLSREM